MNECDKFDDKLISIIMPSYNSAEYIRSSIMSVINQTYREWELIIVDDCSEDDTVNIIKGYNDERIKLFVNKKNEGAALSRNTALRNASGRWIAFLDSDDVWDKEKLRIQMEYMKKNNYAFSYTDYMLQMNGELLPYIYTAPNHINKRKIYDYCYISTITVMYDQTVVGLIQIEDLKKNNDYAMWLLAIEKTDFYRCPKCLSYYIKHKGSISSGNKLMLIKWHYILFRKGMKRGRIMSCVFTVNNLIHGLVKKILYRKRL